MIAATVSTSLALLFHVAGGGAVPGVLGVAMPLVLTSLVGLSAGGARPNFAGLLATTSSAQFLFHALFTFDSPDAAAGHAGHGSAVGVVPDMGAATAGDAWMWQMHVAAALLTAVVLHRGELAAMWLRRVLAALVGHLRPAMPAPLPVLGAIVSMPSAPVPVRTASVALVRTAPRRGPPVLVGT